MCNMIALVELRSSFDLANDKEGALIICEEAKENVDSAFSRTFFWGDKIIPKTLLLEAVTIDIRMNISATTILWYQRWKQQE